MPTLELRVYCCLLYKRLHQRSGALAHCELVLEDVWKVKTSSSNDILSVDKNEGDASGKAIAYAPVVEEIALKAGL
ncbi:hypothetical protein CLI64_29745 (plasmid) [Nostoc sp. CENA543]|uniref:hypothetical protein n=1 Tax=Nostoc sp. CENA543 TaxID=1869241 RepID=UPI000CA0C01B|nr:hypothetical protein [Nostoc sp. CENA543]AUT04624.1 hypothetical protein CLI64_29745 [Nostoc sp. CENA543]